MPVASVDPMASRIRRTFPAVGAALLALALVTGCAPEPAPTPTPTGFASDDEAFAAAEATYRAYVDALNAVDLSDPATFEPVYSLLSGSALSSSKRTLSQLHAEGYLRSGDTDFRQAVLDSADLEARRITISLCLDVSQVDIVDSSGSSVVGADRLDVQPLDVTFVGLPGHLLIDDSVASEVITCG